MLLRYSSLLVIIFLTIFFINFRNVVSSPKRFKVNSVPMNCNKTDVVGNCAEIIKVRRFGSYNELKVPPKVTFCSV